MVAAIRNGDAFAFEQAYLQTSAKLYGYFLKRTQSDEDARDLVQNTYLKLWQYRASLSDDFLLEQHLFQIARTVFIDHLRKQNKQSRIQELISLTPAGNRSPVHPSHEFDMHTELQDALSAMPKTRKKVFELNRIHGYSYQEVAEILSISVKSVDNNLYKALQQLRKTLLFIFILLLLRSGL